MFYNFCMFKWFKKKNSNNKERISDEMKYAVGAILDKFSVKSFDNMLFFGEVNQSAKWFFEKSGVWVDCESLVENTERVHFLKSKDLSSLPTYDFVVFANDFKLFGRGNEDETLKNLLTDGGRAIFISTAEPLPDNIKSVLKSFSFDVETDGEVKVLSCVKND